MSKLSVCLRAVCLLRIGQRHAYSGSGRLSVLGMHPEYVYLYSGVVLLKLHTQSSKG